MKAVTYTLTVPKNNLEQYVECVLKRIYSFTEEELWFLNSSEKPQDNHVTLKEETDEFYRIEFRRCTFGPVCNALPETIVSPGTVFYAGSSLVNAAKEKISNVVRAVQHDVITSSSSVRLDAEKLEKIIKQLANEKSIDKFFKIRKGAFICVLQGVPLYVTQPFGNVLDAVPMYSLTFDIDDGFYDGPGKDELNAYYNAWVKNGDLSASIIPPNDLRLNGDGVAMPNYSAMSEADQKKHRSIFMQKFNVLKTHCPTCSIVKPSDDCPLDEVHNLYVSMVKKVSKFWFDELNSVMTMEERERLLSQ